MRIFVPFGGIAKTMKIPKESRNFSNAVNIMKKAFDEAVYKNLFKRRAVVNLYLEPYDPKDGEACVKTLILGEPESMEHSDQLIHLPQVTLEYDFKIMQFFADEFHINSVNMSLSDNPIADFYESILDSDLLEQWKAFRKSAYDTAFDSWLSEHREEIEMIFKADTQ